MDNVASLKTVKSAHSPSIWSTAHLRLLGETQGMAAGLIGASDVNRICPDLDLWDVWPLQSADGSVAEIAGGSLWMILSAPILPNPNARHDVSDDVPRFKVLCDQPAVLVLQP